MREYLLLMAVAKALTGRIKKADTTTRAAVAEEMEEGDHLAILLPGPDGERIRIGAGGLSKARVSVEITDEEALLAWVKKHHPGWIETVERVRKEDRERLIAGAKHAGEAVDTTTGMEIPGLVVRTGTPIPYVRLDGEGEEAILREVRERLGPALSRVIDGEPPEIDP